MSSTSRTQNASTAVEHVLETLLREPLPPTRQDYGTYRAVFVALGITTIYDFTLIRTPDLFEVKYDVFTYGAPPDAGGSPQMVTTETHLTHLEIRTLESLQLLYQDQTYKNPTTKKRVIFF